MSLSSHNHGFTLIELLVVVTILAVLVAMMLPAISRSREAARTVLCGGKISQLSQMCHLYVVDHKNRFPTHTHVTSNLHVVYLTDLLGDYYNLGSGNHRQVAAEYSSEFGWVNGPLRCPSITPNLGHSSIRLQSRRHYYTLTANYRLSGLLVRTSGNGYLNGRPVSVVRRPSQVFSVYETPHTVYGDSIRAYYGENPHGIGSNWAAFGYNGNPRFFHFDDTDDPTGNIAPKRQGSANMAMLDGSVRRLTDQEHRQACLDGSLGWTIPNN